MCASRGGLERAVLVEISVSRKWFGTKGDGWALALILLRTVVDGCTFVPAHREAIAAS
jgi:hypothetical protein